MRRAERDRRRAIAVATLVAAALVLVVAVIVGVSLARAARAEASAKKPAIRPAIATEATETREPTPKKPRKKPAAKPQAAKAPAPKPKPAAPAVQRLTIGFGQYGYEPSSLTAKAGVPIKLTVARGEGCAAGFLIPSLNIAADNSGGPAVVDLGSLKPGTYRFSCGMEMVTGTLVVGG